VPSTTAGEFYQALGYGQSVQDAFDVGRYRLAAEGLTDAEKRVELHARAGVNLPTVILVGSRPEPGKKYIPEPDSMERSETRGILERTEPTIGIVTALPHEFVAVKAMLEDPKDYHVPGESLRYVLGRIPGAEGRDHPVVLALGDMGNNLAAVHTTRLKTHFPNLNALLMVGIAGGAPNPAKPGDHVRLGDIVVSDKYGVAQFDFGKQTASGYQYRQAPRPPSANLLVSARHLRTREIEGQRPWERHLGRALATLGWNRPPGEKDFLGDSADHRKRIEHPQDPERVEGQPRIFFGLIASSNTLLKDPVQRDELRDRFGARAIEMETAGLADAAWVLEIGYLGVRGICDYCDENKNDDWQPYAALAAAAYVRALLESIPGSISALPAEGAVATIGPTASLPSPKTPRRPRGPARPRAKSTAPLSAAPNPPTPTRPSSGVSAPAAEPTGLIDRATLVHTLFGLAPGDMAKILTLIEGAATHISRHGTVPEQAADLIRWAESSTGPGLVAIQRALIGLETPRRIPRRGEGRGEEARARAFGEESPRIEDSTGSSERASAGVDDRRKAYGDLIRSTLDEKLESLGRDEGQAPRMLDRVATAIEIKNPPLEEPRLRKTIAGHLLDVKDSQAIPRLNKLYLDLCRERKEKPADLIADCIDLLFPLYFSWDVIELAARQLERQKYVIIEGAVSSMPGADVVMAVHDGGSTCFVPHAEGPRGKHAIRMDRPPIAEPSVEHEACQNLDQILRQLGFPQDVRGTDGARGDVAARTRRLGSDLNGILDGYRIQHGRSLYCVVKKQESEEDRRYALKVLERLRELVPRLVLIELDPDAPARQSEGTLGYCLILRYREVQKRSSP
jgi:nucleoside phosphorylase